MIQKTPTAFILLVLTVTLLTGCEDEPPKPQAVVIDVRAVSEAAGINEQIKEHLQTLNQHLAKERKVLSAKLNKELEVEKFRLGENPSEEDEKKIQTLQKQFQEQFRQFSLASNARRVKEKSEMWEFFISGIMPIAELVALERGASIILKANTGVFWSEASIEITDEVIRRMPGGKNSQPVDKVQE